MMKPQMKYKSSSSFKLMLAVMILMLVTTACLSPFEKTESNPSYHESVKRIQSAVEDYQKELELLPIINADQDTPRYEKFRVDMEKLKNTGFIDEIPNTAFEKGGSGYFLIINEESTPTVKVMDIATVQKVNDVQQAVDKYKRAHNNELPKGEEIYPNVYTVDLSKANIPSIKIQSVYSNEEMAFMMNNDGQVYVDYAFDIMQAIEKSGQEPQDNEDLRNYLVDNSYFVPVKSLPYSWVAGAPVASIE